MMSAHPLLLYAEEGSETVESAAVALLLFAASRLGLRPSTRFAALGILVDRVLPVVQNESLETEVPALAAIALACILISTKQHERTAPLLSEIVAAATTTAPARVSVREVAAAELFLCCWVRIGASPLLYERVALILESHTQLPKLELCASIIEMLMQTAPVGWLTTTSPRLPIAVVAAAAALSVPPHARAQHAPLIAWLAGEDAAEVHSTTALILSHILSES